MYSSDYCLISEHYNVVNTHAFTHAYNAFKNVFFGIWAEKG